MNASPISFQYAVWLKVIPFSSCLVRYHDPWLWRKRGYRPANANPRTSTSPKPVSYGVWYILNKPYLKTRADSWSLTVLLSPHQMNEQVFTWDYTAHVIMQQGPFTCVCCLWMCNDRYEFCGPQGPQAVRGPQSRRTALPVPPPPQRSLAR